MLNHILMTGMYMKLVSVLQVHSAVMHSSSYEGGLQTSLPSILSLIKKIREVFSEGLKCFDNYRHKSSS